MDNDSMNNYSFFFVFSHIFLFLLCINIIFIIKQAPIGYFFPRYITTITRFSPSLFSTHIFSNGQCFFKAGSIRPKKCPEETLSAFPYLLMP